MSAIRGQGEAGRGLRSVAFAAWMFALGVGMGFACLPLLLLPRRYTVGAVKLWTRLVIWGLARMVGLTFRVAGGEHLPTGGALVAAKHQGMLDVLAAVTLFPDPCVVLKRELMWLPFFGWYAAKCGMIPIDRGSGSSALRAMTRAAREALADGRQVVIFPEGTRRAPGAPPDYKPGIAGLYRELGVPCVPMGTDSGLYWPAHGLLKRPGVAVFALRPPIPAGMKRGAFMEALEAEIEGAVHQSRSAVE